MSAPDYDPALIRELDDAAGDVLRSHGLAVTSEVHAAIRAAVVDCVLVAAKHLREGTLTAEAPPVRELPTEPGAVVLADVAGQRVSLVLRDDGLWFSPVKVDGKYWFVGDGIDDWAPMVFVRDDERGPVIALRRIAAAAHRPDARGCIKTLQAVEFAAREALTALDGDA